MDLSHSGRHLPGRLAVLVLRDGDKTPVSAPIGGSVAVGGGGGSAWDVEEDRAWGRIS